MAHVHNAIHRYASLLQGIKRAVGLDADADGTDRLGESLTPVMDVFGRPEWEYLIGTFRVMESAELAAPGVGLINKIQCFNPAASGSMVVVSEVWASVATTATLRLRVGGTALTTLRQLQCLDTRAFTGGAPNVPRSAKAVLATNQDANSYDTNIAFIVALANTMVSLRPMQVLSPGFGLQVQADPNVGLTVAFLGWERQLLPGELLR